MRPRKLPTSGIKYSFCQRSRIRRLSLLLPLPSSSIDVMPTGTRNVIESVNEIAPRNMIDDVSNPLFLRLKVSAYFPTRIMPDMTPSIERIAMESRSWMAGSSSSSLLSSLSEGAGGGNSLSHTGRNIPTENSR